MAISRSLMNRQLRASGGIMDVTPRENFGLGSSLKKFVRKIIPNEISEIAVKAAPFVAPFNPQIAAAMAGIGGFDQTGRIGDSLMSAGKTYAGGQAARYIGGAGFQDPSMAAFTPSGFTAGFSMPTGTSTGLGKFFSNQGTVGKEAIQGIGTGTTGDANIAEQIAAQGRAVNADSTGLFAEGLTGGNSTIADAATQTITGSPNQMTITDSIKQIVSPNSTMGDRGTAALDLLKRTGKAAFTKPIPGTNKTQLDKAAVLGAIAFTASYAEAKGLAEEAGIEITPEEYDESRKAEKQEEYAGYLTNFFGGKKDGGRIGYEGGANELIMEKLKEDIMPDTSTEDMIMIMTEAGPKMIKRSDYESMSGMFRDTTTSLYGDAARGRPVPEFANGGRIGYKDGTYYVGSKSNQSMEDEYDSYIKEIEIEEGVPMSFSSFKKMLSEDYAKGGRVNRRFGSPEKGEGDGLMEMLSVDVDAGGDDEEDMKMAYSDAIFDRREKSALFRSLGDPRMQQTTKSFKDLDKILKNPGMFLEDEFMLKQYLKLKGFKDGGRIGLKDGTTGSSNRVAQLIQTRDYLLSKDEDVSFIDIELESLGYKMKAEGGIMEAKVPTGQMRKNNAGVAERDYRQTGGFVPVGIKERADDVPAMLSKNEFVMTADAVRGLGNGSVEEGSKKLYNTMKQAEQKGKIA